jgi:hypothetical protein
MSQQPTMEERIDEACFRFMTDPALAVLRASWEGQTLRSVLPPGPIDTNRLLMSQGDRERYLSIMSRADRHKSRRGKEE